MRIIEGEPSDVSLQVRAFLQPPMKGVVLQTFGAGNVPAEKSLLEVLKEACDRQVVVVNCTQCARGNVTTNYPAARVSGPRGRVMNQKPRKGREKESGVLTLSKGEWNINKV